VMMFSKLEKKLISSEIKKHPAIQRLAVKATQNRDVQRDIDHLVYELSKGNLEAGLGKPGHIQGTSIFYMRGRKGGRLYFRKSPHGFDIVGKSAKGSNQQKVMEALKKTYSPYKSK